MQTQKPFHGERYLGRSQSSLLKRSGARETEREREGEDCSVHGSWIKSSLCVCSCYISGSENVHYLRLTEIKLLCKVNEAFAYYVCFYALFQKIVYGVYVHQLAGFTVSPCVPTNPFILWFPKYGFAIISRRHTAQWSLSTMSVIYQPKCIDYSERNIFSAWSLA